MKLRLNSVPSLRKSPGLFPRRLPSLRHLLSSLSLALAVMTAMTAVASAAPAPVDLAGARAALASGAVAWDLRASGALPPGAVRLPSAAVSAWFDRGDVAALSAAVSAAGLNLSAAVLVVADDAAAAQAVAERLGPLARGRVLWLADGMTAWQHAGLPTVAEPALRLPLPQRLVAPEAAATAALQPAAAARRHTAAFSLAPAALSVAQTEVQAAQPRRGSGGI